MYKKVKPADISTMENQKYEGHNTICQKIREVYHLTQDEEIKYRCREMLSMSKAMHNRLKFYKQQEALRQQESK